MPDVEGWWGGGQEETLWSPELRAPAPSVLQACLCQLPLPLQPLGQHPLHGAAGPGCHRKCRVHFLLQRESQTGVTLARPCCRHRVGTEEPRHQQLCSRPLPELSRAYRRGDRVLGGQHAGRPQQLKQGASGKRPATCFCHN